LKETGIVTKNVKEVLRCADRSFCYLSLSKVDGKCKLEKQTKHRKNIADIIGITTKLTFSPCVVFVVAFCYLGHPKNLFIY